MKYYKNTDGVFAYETEQERNEWGASELVEMTQEEVNAHLNPPVVITVPRVVTMRQARLALHAAGLLSQVEAAIDALPEPPRTAARIEWDYSSKVYKDREFVQMLGGALGLDAEAIDQLFVTAATL